MQAVLEQGVQTALATAASRLKEPWMQGVVQTSLLKQVVGLMQQCQPALEEQALVLERAEPGAEC